MELDQQLQVLIDQAPQDGTMPQVIVAIAPILKFLAQQLKHTQYYIMQSLNGRWVSTTLSHNHQPDLEKTVIYAYATRQDAFTNPSLRRDLEAIATPIPVTHLLFQLLALDTVDSLVFFETPGTVNAAIEVKRDEVQELITTHLQRLKQGELGGKPSIPPNLA